MNDIQILTGEDAAAAGGEADFAGFKSPRRYQIDEALNRRACNMLSEAFAGQFGADYRLAEAFTTSDFKLAAFAQLDYELQRQYAELPTVWSQYTDVTTVDDFRPKRLLSRWRNTIGFARVPELTEYPADDQRAQSAYAIAVAKYGRRFAISWEAWLNNEAVGELEDLPGELARQARETETIAALSNLLLVDPKTNLASNVNTDFFKTANGNAPATVPLTRANLKTVLDGMKVKKDPNNKRQIGNPPLVLVVPKALEPVVEGIIAVNQVEITDGTTKTTEDNQLKNIDYVVDPMLDYLNGHAKAATTWFVLPKPGSPRPATWVARLRGHEAPDLRVKADAGQRIGGGSISPLEGSFEIDDIQYRGRHIVGNQTADPLFTYVSYGS